jgi:hypothetical protein
MSQKRDLGPVLALVGGGIAIAAIIAGFMITGGPGDARDRRLDEMTTQRLYTVATMVNCAFVMDGAAPPDMGAAREGAFNAMRTQPDRIACARFTPNSEMPGADYTRIDDTTIRLCADFLRPYTAALDGQAEFYSPDYMAFPELRATRPAGRHCYDIELTRPPAPTQ